MKAVILLLQATDHQLTVKLAVELLVPGFLPDVHWLLCLLRAFVMYKELCLLLAVM